jgi:hypothetical protein
MIRVLALGALLGCAGMAKPTEDLMYDLRAFQDGLRWRKYEQAAQYVPPAARDRFLDAHDEVDADLRIDDYELERVKLDEGQLRALVRVKYTWHLDSVGAVHDTVVDERWEKEGKAWRIVASEHRRGEPMPEPASGL